VSLKGIRSQANRPLTDDTSNALVSINRCGADFDTAAGIDFFDEVNPAVVVN
jgi:hypothetical protein